MSINRTPTPVCRLQVKLDRQKCEITIEEEHVFVVYKGEKRTSIKNIQITENVGADKGLDFFIGRQQVDIPVALDSVWMYCCAHSVDWAEAYYNCEKITKDFVISTCLDKMREKSDSRIAEYSEGLKKRYLERAIFNEAVSKSILPSE